MTNHSFIRSHFLTTYIQTFQGSAVISCTSIDCFGYELQAIDFFCMFNQMLLLDMLSKMSLFDSNKRAIYQLAEELQKAVHTDEVFSSISFQGAVNDHSDQFNIDQQRPLHKSTPHEKSSVYQHLLPQNNARMHTSTSTRMIHGMMQ